MWLYCPKCGQSFDEPYERYQMTGGQIPCPVCRTPLVPDLSAAPGSPGQQAYGSAGPSYSANPPAQGYVKANAPHRTAPSTPSSTPYLEESGGYVSPPPQPQDLGPQVPPPQAVDPALQTMPVPGPRKKIKRKVVVGGAAVASAEAMTQALDVEVLKGLERDPDMGVPSLDNRPPLGQPGPSAQPDSAQMAPSGHGQQRQVVVGSFGQQTGGSSSPITATEEATGKTWWPTLLIGGVLALIVATLLSVVGVLPTPGFLPHLREQESNDTSAASAAPTNELARIDTLLQRMRSQIEPVASSPAWSPTGMGIALGVRGTTGGQTQCWLSTPQEPQPTLINSGLDSAIATTDATIFVLFDQTTDARTAIHTLDQLRSAGLSPAITGGSHLGPDVYFAYRADGDMNAPVTVHIFNGAVQVWKSGWSDPRNLCFGSSFPVVRLKDLLSEVYSDMPSPIHIRIEVSDSISLPTILQAAHAAHREDMHLYLALVAEQPLPTECTQ